MSARDELVTLVLPVLERCFDSDWNVTYSEMVADVICAAGYSKPRTITTAEELDALPPGSMIRAVKARSPKFGEVFERFRSGWLHLDPSDRDDGVSTLPSADVLKWYGDLSVTLLYSPEES